MPSNALLSMTLLLTLNGQAPSPPAGETPHIVVSDPVQVSADRPEAPHVETILATHPTDPDVLFGAAVTFPADLRLAIDSHFVAGFRSADGGRSWTPVELPGCRIDPWVSFSPGGGLFASCMGGREKPLLVHRSADAGRTWESAPVPLGDGGPPDHPVLAAGAEGVYVASGQSFPAPGLEGRIYGPAISRSGDGGRTFSQPVFLRHDNLTQQPFDAALLSSGAFVVLFMDFADQADSPLAHRRTWMARTEDGGRTFSTPALVFEQTGKEMPWSVAVDRSPEHRDRLYLAVDGWWERPGREPARPGPGAALFVRTSDDGGQTWKAGGTVTDAPPGANAETPAVAVNRDGVVAVAWYDTRHSPEGDCWDLYVSASLDGGTSFLPNVRVTPETSCPHAAAHRGVAARWPFGGDYSGLAAGADGRFHVFWVDSRTGTYQVWTAAVRVGLEA